MFFIHEKVTERIIRIRDISYTAMYLVLGDEKTALLDTGMGIGNIREYIKDNFSRDVDLVILTHGHFDHASGASLFSDIPVYLNEKDRKLMNDHVFNQQKRIEYTRIIQQRIKMLFSDFSDRDVLEGYDSKNTIPLYDGDVFDLGGITLKAIAAPGHTQGIMTILFPEERLMLFGDACGERVLLVEDCCSTVKDYRDSLLKIKQFENQYDRILRNHGTCESDKELLDNVIDVCTDILEGKDDRIPTRSVIDTEYPVFEAKAVNPENKKRIDGKQGNIIYAENKIR